MSHWTDVVTTALLGTNRRPLPADLPDVWAAPADQRERDPATVLLQMAAAHRAASRAGSRLDTCPPPESGPAEWLVRAPEPAQVLLGRLLTGPQPDGLNLWMSACVAGGWGAGVEHWTTLAGAAARSVGVDRALLRQVLGRRGVWFLSQRAEWSLLASKRQPTRSPAANAVGSSEPSRPSVTNAKDGSPAAAQLSQLLAGPDPLPPVQVGAALQLLGSGAFGPSSRAAGVLLGQRLPLEVLPALAELPAPYLTGEGLTGELTVGGLSGGGRASAHTLRWVRDGWLAMEQGLLLRRDIEDSFRPEPVAASPETRPSADESGPT